MNHLELRQILNKKNIYLFDSYYRIIAYKLQSDSVQTGGGINNSIKSKLNKMKSKYISLLLESIVYDNEQRTQYILNHF
jgi:hypothetical protein